LEQYHALFEGLQRKCMSGIIAKPVDMAKHVRQYVTTCATQDPSPKD
jgi:hypothetical protein